MCCVALPLTGTPQPNGAEADPKRRECELPFGKGIETAFADGYPFLITTEVAPLHSTAQMLDSAPNVVCVCSLACAILPIGHSFAVIRFCMHEALAKEAVLPS